MTKSEQQTPKMQHKRPMPKNRIQNLQGHSKEDLRQKGAAAVFRAACSIRRSTPGAVVRVRHTDIHLYVFVYLSSMINGPSLNPARDSGLSDVSPFWPHDPCPFSHKNRRRFLIDFWSQNWTKMDINWEPKSIKNRSKICMIFWSSFGCDFDPKRFRKMVPKTIKNHEKIIPEPYLVWKAWFSQK